MKEPPDREEDRLVETGINHELRDQIVMALYDLVSELLKSALEAIAGDLLERASVEWIVDRFEILDEKFAISDIFDDPTFVA